MLEKNLRCHSRESGNLVIVSTCWIPAYAGMTLFFHSATIRHCEEGEARCGNPELFAGLPRYARNDE